MKIKWVYFAYCSIIIVQFFLFVITRLHIDPTHKAGFIYFSLSDWLINYRGGFVRRGLCGEFLTSMYEYTNINIGTIIWAICIFSTIALLLMSVYLFIKSKLSVFLFPTVVMFGGFAMNRLTLYRRDALVLLIILLCIFLYKRWVTNERNKHLHYILFCFVSSLVILIHEASFFSFIPYLILIHIFSDKYRGGTIGIIKRAIPFVPIILTMGIVCVYKGDSITAHKIWESHSLFFNNTYGEILPMGQGVEALTWDSERTFLFHLNENWFYPIYKYIPRIFAWCFIYFFTLYLCANVNKVRLFSYERKEINSKYLISILITQFISHIPLFTILSCDQRRILIPWILSSFFIFILFNNRKLHGNIAFIRKTSDFIDKIFATNKLFANKYFYIIIATTIIVPFACFPLPKTLYTSVIGNLIYILQNLF